MSRRAILLGCFCLGLMLAVPGVKVLASTYGARQYYGTTYKHQRYGYSYRPLYYKPTASFGGYRHHYAVYHPRYRNHVYFYNPYKKTYWGRCPVNYGDKPVYSMLAEKDRRATIEEIDEAAFPTPGKLPPLPDSDDGATLELPPDDVPGDKGLPESGTKGK